jgi:hypothetical protein
MSDNLEFYTDQEVEFTYEGIPYIWQGEYSVELNGEEESEFAPSYFENEVSINHTSSLSYYDEELDLVVQVKPTPSILFHIELVIEHNL